jgi:aminoglycoside/choline kinase family phosphotransferase
LTADPRLAASPFAAWQAAPLAGDASARHYTRLTGPDGDSVILMDASGDPPSATAAFITLARLLASHSLAAPAILWTDPAGTLLVVEDLGRHTFAEWLAAHPGDEARLYTAAVDLLPAVQAVPLPAGLVTFTPAHAAGLIAPLFDHYLATPPATLQAEVTGLLQEALSTLPPGRERLALRDFHAENLIWRPHHDDATRIGLLDFQDAVAAPPEYDLVSLLRDARRDVPDPLRSALMDRFAAITGQEAGLVTRSCALWGVQRNLRILGIFARLAGSGGKPRYRALMPRVHSQIMADLAHPALASLAPLLRRNLPPPPGGAA